MLINLVTVTAAGFGSTTYSTDLAPLLSSSLVIISIKLLIPTFIKFLLLQVFTIAPSPGSGSSHISSSHISMATDGTGDLNSDKNRAKLNSLVFPNYAESVLYTALNYIFYLTISQRTEESYRGIGELY